MRDLFCRVVFFSSAFFTVVIIIYTAPYAGFLNGEFILIPIFSCVAALAFSFLFYRGLLQIILSALVANLIVLTFGIISIIYIVYGLLDRVHDYNKILLNNLYAYSGVASLLLSVLAAILIKLIGFGVGSLMNFLNSKGKL